MLEQQALTGRLVAQQFHSIEALRQLGSTFVDEISDVLCKQDTSTQQFLSSQKSPNEDRAEVFLHSVKNALNMPIASQETDLSARILHHCYSSSKFDLMYYIIVTKVHSHIRGR